MTDRELLELAAKAAGMAAFVTAPSWSKGFCVQDGSGGGWYPWNPLTDDGDALRLAVRLQMSMDTALAQSMAIALDGRDCVERHEGDPYAATRRAIVRAAAGRVT
jgi:hypothetical protein